ncbi:MAG: nicotinate (nicotinamide) nucleotide adenylyltransferase [Anaerolineae bacterium]|nr:nicotinate (nicotinamide) nucleotide adenylyltransferase [Anaerolineae bacterium]
MVERLGILGGTFDPPHIAHLILAEMAREQLRLDRVLWVPAADPPHKPGTVVAPIEHRLAMLRLALANNPDFEISLVDVERPGPHYSADMLEIVYERYAQPELIFLIGGDSLRDLPLWHQPWRVIQHAMLGVMQRTREEIDLRALEQQIPGIIDRILPVDAPLIELSSNLIRSLRAQSRSIRYMVPAPIEAYISSHSLYCD